jgi:hypothetical protein
MTILDEEIVSAVESSVGSNDLRIEKDTLFIFGGASLVLFGAGMILATPLARRLLGQFDTGKVIQSALADVERYIKLRTM